MPAGAANALTRTQALTLAAILAAAAIVRFWDLGGPSYWVDELYTLNFGRLPVIQLWSDWMQREPNPPLYYFMAHLWHGLFGEHEFAARTLPAMLGVGVVAAIFLIGRALHSGNAGLLAAVVAAVASQQLQYSQQIRSYTLGALASALAILALIRLTDRWKAGPSSLSAAAPDLLLYAGATSAAFYSHTPFFILPVLANIYMAWLWTFRTPRRLSDGAGWLLANMVVVLVCSWWIWTTVQHMRLGAGMIDWMEQSTPRVAIIKLVNTLGARMLGDFNYLVGAVFIGLMAWGASRLTPERRMLALVFAIGVPLLLYLISFRQVIYLERTLYWTQNVWLPLLAVGIVTFPWGRARVPLAAIAAGLMLADAVAWRHSWYREPWREAGEKIAAGVRPGDVVLAYSVDAAANLAVYCPPDVCNGEQTLAIRFGERVAVLRDIFRGHELRPAELASATAPYDRIWVISRGANDNPGRHLDGIACRIAPDMLTSDPVRGPDLSPLNHMTLTIWRPGPCG